MLHWLSISKQVQHDVSFWWKKKNGHWVILANYYLYYTCSLPKWISSPRQPRQPSLCLRFRESSIVENTGESVGIPPFWGLKWTDPAFGLICANFVWKGFPTAFPWSTCAWSGCGLAKGFTAFSGAFSAFSGDFSISSGSPSASASTWGLRMLWHWPSESIRSSCNCADSWSNLIHLAVTTLRRNLQRGNKLNFCDHHAAHAAHAVLHKFT